MALYENRPGFSYTFTGTLAGQIQTGRTAITTPDIGATEFVVECGGFVRFHGHVNSSPTSPSFGVYFLLELIWIGTGFTGTGATSLVDYAGPPLPPVYYSPTGTWSVTINLDEKVDVTSGAVGSPALLDELPADINLVFEALATFGGTVTATCNYGGNSVSDTAVVSLPNISITPTVLVNLNIYSNSNHTGTMHTLTTTVVPLWNGQSIAAAGGTSSNGFVTGTWGAAVSLTADPDHNGVVAFEAVAPTRYDLQGKVYAIDQPYPVSGLLVRVAEKIDGLTGAPVYVDCAVSGGAFGAGTITQDSWAAGVVLDGITTVNETFEERAPVTCWLLSSGLSACGEDIDLSLRHLWCRGWTWDAASVVQAGSLDAISGTWAGVGGVSTIVVSSAAFDSRLLGTSWSGASLAGYAFADIFLTADAAGQPARINFGGKYWDVVVGLTGHVTIDLCSPTTPHADTDNVNSIYPLVGTGPYSATDGWSTGVHNAPNVTVDHLASGHVYTLTKITLNRTDHALVTFMDSFKAWELATSSTVAGVTSTTYYRQFGLGDTDGQQSLEQTDAVRQILSGSSTGDTASMIDIKTFCANINGAGGAYPTDGWTAADLQATDHSANVRYGLLNSDQPATLLGGAGASYDGSAWHTWADRDASAVLTVPANFFYNSIKVYPAAGDPFFGGGVGVPTPVRPAIVLRGQAWGLVENRDGTRASGKTVTAVDSTSHASDGSSVTTSVGEFHTGTPWIPGLTSANIQTGTSAAMMQSFATRQRRRFALTVSALLRGLALLDDQRGHWEADARDDGTLHIERAWSADMALMDTFLIDSATDCAEPGLCMNSHTGRISAIYRRGDGGATPYAIYRATSDDNGQSWLPTPSSGPYKAGSGSVSIKHAQEVFNRRTEERLFFYNDGTGGSGTGLLQVDIFDASDVLIGTFPTGAGGIAGLTADDASFGASYITTPTSALGVSFVVSGARRRFRSTDDGRSWWELT